MTISEFFLRNYRELEYASLAEIGATICEFKTSTKISKPVIGINFFSDLLAIVLLHNSSLHLALKVEKLD